MPKFVVAGAIAGATCAIFCAFSPAMRNKAEAHVMSSERQQSIYKMGWVAKARGVPVPRGCRFFFGLGLSVTPSLLASLYASEASSGLLNVEPRLYRLPSSTIRAENLPEVVLLTPSGKSFLRRGAREAPRAGSRRAGSTLPPRMATGRGG